MSDDISKGVASHSSPPKKYTKKLLDRCVGEGVWCDGGPSVPLAQRKGAGRLQRYQLHALCPVSSTQSGFDIGRVERCVLRLPIY
jgi:hypothetical protein